MSDRIPDGVSEGMEIEVAADDLGLPLVPWQRRVLLRWFPRPRLADNGRPPENDGSDDE